MSNKPPALPYTQGAAGVEASVGDNVFRCVGFDQSSYALQVSVAHVTPPTAEAMVRVAELTYAEPAKQRVMEARCRYAIPAEEATKQARQPTWRHALTVGAVLFGIALMCMYPSLAKYITTVLVVVGGGYYATDAIEKWRGPRKPPGGGSRNGNGGAEG